MEKITEIIIDYIKNPRTNYALLIDGMWGSGKTYFFKNEVTQEIEKIIKNEKELKVLYVSLNGINSLDDIYKQIAAEKYYTGTKTAKVGYGIVKSLANIVNINIDENFKLEDFISFSNTVLVFDDLERISTEIDIADILGFINTNFVEHNKIKTIIIANEKEFKKKDEGEYYSQIKEKIIGRTLVYQPNLKNIIPQIIEIFKTEKEDGYYQILKENIDYIITLLKNLDISNLRTIIFSFEILNKVATTELLVLVKKHIKKLILFTLTISQEFKTGALKSSDSNDTKGLEFIDKNYNMSYMAHMLSLSNDEDDENEKFKSFANDFFEKYLKSQINNYHFFKSLYSYILTGELNILLIEKELEEIQEEIIPQEVEIQQKIYNFRSLSEEEFKDLLPKFLKNIEDGLYNLYTYPSLFSYVKFFADYNLLSLSKEEIYKLFEKGLSNVNKDIKASDYEFDRIRHFSSHDPDVRQIEKKVMDIHNELIQKEEEKKLNKLIYNIEKGKEVKEIFEELKFKPIFHLIDIDKFYKSLLATSNSNRDEIYLQFEIRYNSVNIGEFLFDDYNGLYELKQKLDKFLEDENNTIRAFHLRVLSKKINEILIKLKKFSR